MNTKLLRLFALCFVCMALSLFAYDHGGGGNGAGGGTPSCPDGYQWDASIEECVPRQWVLKPCYTVFGDSSPENDYYATCQNGTRDGILMECGAVTPKAPLPISRSFQCIEVAPRGGS